MGKYINTGNTSFVKARNSTYIDKTGLISFINSTLNTERCYSCITRCRRFGKSMAAKMLCAYYDCSCDSRALFSDLQIAQDPNFETYLNKFRVIYLDVTDFTTIHKNDPKIVQYIQDALKKDLLDFYPGTAARESESLMSVLTTIAMETQERFVMIIDEWDAILREFDKNKETVDEYVDMCRSLFKGANSDRVFAGVYMTGILPIKKYKTESALNNFREYSMIHPGKLAPYLGFTKQEVHALCQLHGMDFDQMEQWYDGYKIGEEASMFNPYSVMEAIANERYTTYWAKTGAFESISDYIQMNYEGLKDDIIQMMAGGRCSVDTSSFGNDLSIVKSKDDVLTILIHLGYLSYDWNEEECYIPNMEVRKELENAIKDTSWDCLVRTIRDSKELVENTINGNSEAVARAIDQAHDEHTSILSYNDENSLSCVLSIAYIWARNQYIFHRELATGKGYADLVLIPRKQVQKPAMVIELKYNQDAETAINQIKQKNYPARVADHTDNLLLVGINYDKQQKRHNCTIEKYNK